MKGIIKGLRHISNIFDTKEPEMQIGYPTNVKHVAHIGWDGPSVNSPGWMNEFRSAPLTATVAGDNEEIPHFPSSEFIMTGELPGLLGPKLSEKPDRSSRRKKSSEKSSDAAAEDSPKRESRNSRRHHSSGGDAPEATRHARREMRDTSGENVSGEHELPGIPKQSRRRKVSSRSSRASKAQAYSDQSTQEESVGFQPKHTIVSEEGRS